MHVQLIILCTYFTTIYNNFRLIYFLQYNEGVLSIPEETLTTKNNNKPKKLNNQCKAKQSVDDQTAHPRVASLINTAIPVATMTTSGPRNQGPRDNLIFGNLVTPSASNRVASTITNNNIPPPPNATVVVCILAGTGRADLWLRNNRGQTPLDLCPADQPLRRALIRCCDAAARTRSAQAVTAMTSTRMSLLSDSQMQLLNNAPHANYLNKAPCQEAYESLTVDNPDIPKECSKTIASCTTASFLNNQNDLTDMGASIDLVYPPPSQILPGEDTTTGPCTSTTVNMDNITERINSIDCDDNRYFIIIIDLLLN